MAFQPDNQNLNVNHKSDPHRQFQEQLQAVRKMGYEWRDIRSALKKLRRIDEGNLPVSQNIFEHMSWDDVETIVCNEMIEEVGIVRDGVKGVLTDSGRFEAIRV